MSPTLPVLGAYHKKLDSTSFFKCMVVVEQTYLNMPGAQLPEDEQPSHNFYDCADKRLNAPCHQLQTRDVALYSSNNSSFNNNKNIYTLYFWNLLHLFMHLFWELPVDELSEQNGQMDQ